MKQIYTYQVGSGGSKYIIMVEGVCKSDADDRVRIIVPKLRNAPEFVGTRSGTLEDLVGDRISKKAVRMQQAVSRQRRN